MCLHFDIFDIWHTWQPRLPWNPLYSGNHGCHGNLCHYQPWPLTVERSTVTVGVTAISMVDTSKALPSFWHITPYTSIWNFFDLHLWPGGPPLGPYQNSKLLLTIGYWKHNSKISTRSKVSCTDGPTDVQTEENYNGLNAHKKSFTIIVLLLFHIHNQVINFGVVLPERLFAECIWYMYIRVVINCTIF